MIIVRMVQPALDQIVHMVAMRDRGMTTVWPVNVPCRMPLRPVSADVRMCLVHGNHVLFKVIAFDMVQMALAQIVRVSFVLNRCVPATGPVMMTLLLLFNGAIHGNSFRFSEPNSANGFAQAVVLQPACIVGCAASNAEGFILNSKL